MKKDITKFISENRGTFDDAIPPADLWERISIELDAKAPSRQTISIRSLWLRVLKVAAITFVIGTAGILVYFYGKKHAYEDYARINPELAAEQQVYAQLVVQKKDSIAHIAVSNPVLYNEFSSVLQQMETNYESLKREYAKSPNKTLTLEAMIRNLQAQIQVLSQQLEILDYIDQTKYQTTDEQI